MRSVGISTSSLTVAPFAAQMEALKIQPGEILVVPVTQSPGAPDIVDTPPVTPEVEAPPAHENRQRRRARERREAKESAKARRRRNPDVTYYFDMESGQSKL